MATTTNYGWETPDDTDLVKDGAAAIRTLGNSVDTTTKALNPSTTLGDIEYRSSTSNTNARLGIGSAGQVLTVASGVPSWATPSTGDVTEVQAGTGISVASGTGPVPIVTNTMATAVDAKGDLIVGTGADTFSRLAVGATNGMVLTVDSAEATGLKYATAGGGDFVLITAQTFTASSAVNVNSVFTSTYNNYKVIINVTSTSTSNDFDLRLRASGSDNTNSSYQYTGVNTYSDLDTIYTQRSNSDTAFERMGSANGADDGATNMIYEFLNPQASRRTGLTYHCISSDGSRVIYDSGSGIFDNTTSFDGFSLIVDTGNITGKVYVYGYKV